MSVGLLYCGGTIASQVRGGVRCGDHLVDFSEHIETRNPGIKLTGGETIYSGLSENITPEIWENIAKAVDKLLDSSSPPKSIVLTHGTDSMEQTARYLQQRFGDKLTKLNCRIFLTGANNDLSHPQTDAYANLDFTFQNATSEACEPGVYISFADRIVPADLAVKEPFNGESMKYIRRDDPACLSNTHTLPVNTNVIVYEVNKVRENHNELKDLLKDPTPRIVLFVLYHSGTANATDDEEASVAKLIEDLRASGRICFGVTENGEPIQNPYETTVKLLQAGLIPLAMGRARAITELEQISTQNLSPNELISQMTTAVDPRVQRYLARASS